MNKGYDLDGKSFVVERNDGQGTLLPPGSKLQFKQEDNQVSATYSGGRVARGALTGRIIEAELRHRYSETLTDGRHLTGRATLDIAHRENGLIELKDRWAWESATGEGLCVLVEVAPINAADEDSRAPVASEEMSKERV